jgi:hypothetical protein
MGKLVATLGEGQSLSPGQLESARAAQVQRGVHTPKQIKAEVRSIARRR